MKMKGIEEKEKEKEPSITQPSNVKIIVAYLNHLSDKAKQNKEPFKARAYETAIQSILSLRHSIHTVKDVESLPGIGKSIQAKIEEIIRTGKLSGIQIQNDKEIGLLTQIHGIGHKKAAELYGKGITLENIHEHDNYKELTETQKKGLMYKNDFNSRIPYDEMIEHEKVINSLINEDMNRDPKRTFDADAMVVGSYRRKSSTSGDIDVIVTIRKRESKRERRVKINRTFGNKKDVNQDQNNKSINQTIQKIQDIIKHLKDKDYLVDIFGQGNKKVIGVSRIKNNPFRRIDILFTDPHTFPFAVLYFTGSASFNVALRRYASKKGFRLNEYGIVELEKNKRDTEVKQDQFTNEHDIFRFLGLRYIEPSKRDGDAIQKLKEKEGEKEKEREKVRSR